MAISHTGAQKILQRLCDDQGVNGIKCEVCGKMIYPPDTVGDYKVTDPESYHYIETGGFKRFIHIECMRSARGVK